MNRYFAMCSVSTVKENCSLIYLREPDQKRKISENFVLELRTFVPKKYILVSMFSIIERNGEKRVVKLSLFKQLLNLHYGLN